MISNILKKKDENVHRFALRAIRGELLEIEKGREKERKERERSTQFGEEEASMGWVNAKIG